MGIVYCFHDQLSWGAEVSAEIQRLKGSAQMMTHAVQVEDQKGTCAFAHVHQREQEYVKELWDILAKKTNVYLLPSIREMRFHDDLVQQYVEFGQWMPSSFLLRSMDQAAAIIPEMKYPVVSRSSSHAYQNMRVLQRQVDALTEAKMVFGGDGINLIDGRTQKGYVFWQPVWETQGHIYHVFMLGRKYAVITVVPAASNPSQEDCGFSPVDVLDPRFVELLNYTKLFCDDQELDWASVEVAPARDRVRKVASPFVLGIAASWPFKWFGRGGMIFEDVDGEWKSTGLPAVKIWMVVAKWLLEKSLDE